ncbi:MAG TPA: DUF2911 domain-containing protein [Terriglobales bacterium]|nr:DUF2911 domain-containing protein [Terriglobales bacterium]
MHRLAVLILLVSQLMVGGSGLAQPAESDTNSATAACDFADGQEISVRYKDTVANAKDEPHNGKVWLPGGSPITLFTNVGLTLNHSNIPAGAYSVYVIPNRKEWTLIVNRNVTPDAAYDEKQDIARSPMELGEIDSPPKQLQVSFARVGPKQCGIRLYYGKVGAFTEFTEQ